jgi:hypothetical protein
VWKEVTKVESEEKNAQQQPKEPYATPELIVHGSVETITEEIGSGSRADTLSYYDLN